MEINDDVEVKINQIKDTSHSQYVILKKECLIYEKVQIEPNGGR